MFTIPQKTQPAVDYDEQILPSQVICQVSFPRTLNVLSQMPVGFHRHIQAQFPYVSLTANQKGYYFFAKDRLSHLTLAPQSLSLVTSRYEGWESVREQFFSPVSVLLQEYDLSFFVWGGLRFSHVIRRASLGLAVHEWSELLKTKVPNVSGWDGVSQALRGSRAEVMALDDPAHQLRVIHGVVTVDGETDEQAYLLDYDFSSEKEMNVDDVLSDLNIFQERATVLLRGWVSKIQQRGQLSHASMGLPSDSLLESHFTE